MALREIVEMLDANPRKIRDLGVGENSLARFDGYHRFDSSSAVSLIGPANVGHLVCQESVAQTAGQVSEWMEFTAVVGSWSFAEESED